MKIKYPVSKEKNIFNRKYTSCVFNLFVLVIVSRENELLCFDLSTAAFVCVPQKIWLQMHNLSLRYTQLKLVDHGCMTYFCFL